MEEKNAWEMFKQSGEVEAYLKYKETETHREQEYGDNKDQGIGVASG